MNSKKPKGLLMKIVLFINYYFTKKLVCVSLRHKDLKHFPAGKCWSPGRLLKIQFDRPHDVPI